MCLVYDHISESAKLSSRVTNQPPPLLTTNECFLFSTIAFNTDMLSCGHSYSMHFIIYILIHIYVKSNNYTTCP